MVVIVQQRLILTKILIMAQLHIRLSLVTHCGVFHNSTIQRLAIFKILTILATQQFMLVKS